MVNIPFDLKKKSFEKISTSSKNKMTGELKHDTSTTLLYGLQQHLTDKIDIGSIPHTEGKTSISNFIVSKIKGKKKLKDKNRVMVNSNYCFYKASESVNTVLYFEQ